MIQRPKDLVYETEDLEFLYKYENFPSFMGCVDSSPNEDLLFDMSWFISRKSGIILIILIINSILFIFSQYI